MDQMGTVVSLRTALLKKLLQPICLTYHLQRDCLVILRGVPYPTVLWLMRHSPSEWISCDPIPMAKGRTGCPNYHLSRAKRIVENAFGILAQRLRVFDRRIHMDDHNVIKIVNATCVLHNFLCTAGMDVDNVMARLNPDGQPYLQPQPMLCELQNQGYHCTDAAQRVQRIYKDYFNSEVGAVPWQENQLRHHKN